MTTLNSNKFSIIIYKTYLLALSILLSFSCCINSNYSENHTNRAILLDGEDNNPTFGMGILEAPWTIETWFKHDGDIWKDMEVLIGGGEYSSYEGTDNTPLVIKDGKLHSVLADLWSEDLMDTTWYHVALTNDGHNTTLYLDGEIIDEKPVSNSIILGSLGILEKSNSAFKGYLDEVRVWDACIEHKTIDEWKSKSIRAIHPNFSSLKLYFDFEEDFSESLVNIVGKGNQAYHLKNGRVNYKGNAPLAKTVIIDNDKFKNYYGRPEILTSITIDSEWDVDQGSKEDQIVKLRIVTSGNNKSMLLQQLELDLNNTTNIDDIEAINIYYVGEKIRDTVKVRLFDKDITPKHNITLKGENLPLAEGVNYILVTANISSKAKEGNTIKIDIPSFSVNNKKVVPEKSFGLIDKNITRRIENDNNIFRVLDWNIWHGGLHLGDVGVDRVIELIDKSGADIITMQEAYGSQNRIADEIGYNLNTRYDKDNLAMFSRFTIEPFKSAEPFKSNPGIIRFPNGNKVFINNAWLRYAYNPEYTSQFPDKGLDTKKWIQEDSTFSLVDVRNILNNDIAPNVDDKTPIIIAGDFNSFSHLDWTDAAKDKHNGYGKIDFPTSIFMKENNFIDSFRELNKHEVERAEGTFAVIYGHLQTSRIDFIYYQPNNIKAISSKIIRTSPEIDDVWPSDHAAVVTTFEFIDK